MPFPPNVDLTSLRRLFRSPQRSPPFEISEIITPVIDITEFSKMQSREFETNQVSVSVINETVILEVPDDQYWLVHSLMSVTDLLDADQTITLQLVSIPVPVGALVFGETRFGQPVSVPSLQQGGVGEVFDRPHIVVSRTRLGVAVNELTGAANVRVGVVATITRVQI